MGRRRTSGTLLAAALALAVWTAPAAEGSWVVHGHGLGHGVGMSQYGAYGFAKHGRSYGTILRHYYTGVKIRKTDLRRVRVLIAAGIGTIGFTGADTACGRPLSSRRDYYFSLSGSRVKLREANGAAIKSCGGEGAASGGKSVVYTGQGAYRGALVARAVGGTLYAINRVPIEGYVKGVIPNEVPASWPKHALRAQAVAARSYALSTTLDGDGYDLYDDTRSQVYGGRSSEVSSTNRASAATKREVIKRGGKVAVAFFFSTSGGRTENVEFGFPNGSPSPYLKSVRDPFDGASPDHTWRATFTNAEMRSRLSGLYSGRLKRIKVLRSGVSPRIVRARVIGSRGSSRVSGDDLRFRLGLRSTWARFEKR